MKNTLQSILGGDGAVFWAYGIAIATGLGFVYSAHAIDRHFSIQDCTQSKIENLGLQHNAARSVCIGLYDRN